MVYESLSNSEFLIELSSHVSVAIITSGFVECNKLIQAPFLLEIDWQFTLMTRRDRPLLAGGGLYFLGEDSCTGICCSSSESILRSTDELVVCVNCSRSYSVAGDVVEWWLLLQKEQVQITLLWSNLE